MTVTSPDEDRGEAEHTISPLFDSLTRGMTLTDHDRREA